MGGHRVQWLVCLALTVLSAQVAHAQQQRQQQQRQACKDTRPDSPKDLRLKAMPSTSSIGAVWKAPGNGACVDYYLVYVRPAAGSTREPKAHQVKSRSIIISNLRPNTSYQVDIVAVNKRGRGPNTRNTLTTLNGPSCNPNQRPGPVRNIKGWAVNGRTDKVTINWLPPNSPATACLTGYRLEGFDANSGVRVVVTTVASEIREISVNGLLSGTKYNFKVIPVSSNGDGRDTLVAITTNALTAPPAPAPTPVPTPPRSQPAAPRPPPAPTPAPQTPTNTPAPAPAVSAGQSTGSCYASEKPAAPQSFQATPKDSDKITLRWAAGDTGICIDTYHIDGYELKTGDRVVEVDTPYTEYTLTKLRPGVEYVFTVSGRNRNGESVPGTAMATIPKARS